MPTNFNFCFLVSFNCIKVSKYVLTVQTHSETELNYIYDNSWIFCQEKRLSLRCVLSRVVFLGMREREREREKEREREREVGFERQGV